jgi:hypothetical protein
VGCLVLFGLPFFLAGCFVIYQVVIGKPPKGDFGPVGAVAFGALFALVGLGIMVGGVVGLRAVSRRNALREAHPDEPWLANTSWASGTIHSSSGWGVVFLWVFSLVWSGIGASATFAVLNERKKGALFVLIFPAVGLLLIVLAIHQTMRHLKFGRSMLRLETLPGCVGGWMAGTLHTRTPILSEDLQVKLTCVRRYTSGSGKNRSTHESILWQNEQKLAGRLPQGELGGSAIPVSFQIPGTCRVTDDSNSRDEILWRLSAQAAMPGADYAASFTVPVFNAPATQRQGFVPTTERAAAAVRRALPAQTGQGDDPTIRLMRGPGDRMRFVIPAGRNPGVAVFVTGLAIAFAAAGAIVQYAQGPAFIAYGLELVAALIAWGALNMWFRSIEVSADGRTLERSWRMLGRGGMRTIPIAELGSITYHTNTTVGDTAYYRIDAKLNDGSSVKLASGLRQRDAEWIAGELGSSAGVSADRDTKRELARQAKRGV